MLEIAVAFAPVLLFLLVLILFDSFKLVSWRSLGFAILYGAAAALAAMLINSNLIDWTGLTLREFSRFIAPFSEEVIKFLFIIYLIQSSRTGFLVDAAIYGVAVGTGFAIIENIYYMSSLSDAALTTWFVRGFGTALMHSGVVATGAILCKDLADRKSWPVLPTFLSGLATSILLHLLYNQFLLPPLTLTLIILVTLPPIVYGVYKISENQTRNWLDSGLEHETELLRTLKAGNISDTPVGRYLQTVQESFPGILMADIIGYLRTYLELSIKAKGWIVMKESGVSVPLDNETKAQFRELKFLEKSIGTTGKLALQPLLKMKTRELWQLYKMQEDYNLRAGS